MRFTKMQGCGNDYIYVNGFYEEQKQLIEAIPKLSNRNFGIGGDGLIIIKPSSVADFEMEMYNADGSRAEMCGNGIRCVAKYVYDHGMTNKHEMTIASYGTVKVAKLLLVDDVVKGVQIHMGAPELRTDYIPVCTSLEQVIGQNIDVKGNSYQVTCLSMGNPHAVVFVDSLEELNLEDIGPEFEHHEMFPRGINTEFVEVMSEHHVKMRVWERGSGETLACGTGCCATVVAGVLTGYTQRDVTVEVLGGRIVVEWLAGENEVIMTGPAVQVYEGDIDLVEFLQNNP